MFFVFSSCVEKYWPELKKYENALVVDGTISNNPGPYTVKLSLSSDINDPRFIPYSGSVVSISDDIGNSEILSEEEPGVYKTSPDGIQGICGRKYKIDIKTPDNKSYYSDFEELKTPTEIDSVYSLVEFQHDPDLYYDLTGLQFYVDTKVAKNDTNYYFWRLEETYEYHSSFFIRYIFDGAIKPFYNEDSLYYCWKSKKNDKIYTYNTVNLSTPKIVGFPLNYVTSETRELSVRYSLLVKQLTVSKTIYDFWNSLENQNSEQGSLYSSQPYQVRGNIFNTNNHDESVMGFFIVAGISEKRIFVNRPGPPIKFHYSKCILDDADKEAFLYIGYSAKSYWPIYATQDQGGAPALPNQECLDCTKRGGSIIKPDFWKDE